MTSDPLITEYSFEVHLALTLASAATLMSLPAVWAGLSRRHWFPRAALLPAGGLVLLPTDASEAIVFYAIHFLLVTITLCLVRRFGAWTAVRRGIAPSGSGKITNLGNSVPAILCEDAEGTAAKSAGVQNVLAHPRILASSAMRNVKRLQFGLKDIFLAIAIMSAVTWVFVPSAKDIFIWSELIVTSLAQALLTLGCTWLACGTRHIAVRVLVWLGATVCAATTWVGFSWLREGLWGSPEKIVYAASVALNAATLSLVLVLVRIAGFASISFRDRRAPFRSSNYRRIAAAAGATVILLKALPIIWVYSFMIAPPTYVEQDPSGPNGYYDLLTVEKYLQGASIPDPDVAPPKAFSSFVQEHAWVLNQAKLGLTRPCKIPVGRFQANVGRIALAIDAERYSAQIDRRIADAAHNSFDLIRLGHCGAPWVPISKGPSYPVGVSQMCVMADAMMPSTICITPSA